MYNKKGNSKMLIMIIVLILAIALPLVVRLVQKNQETRSKASQKIDAKCGNMKAGKLCFLGNQEGEPVLNSETNEYTWTCLGTNEGANQICVQEAEE